MFLTCNNKISNFSRNSHRILGNTVLHTPCPATPVTSYTPVLPLLPFDHLLFWLFPVRPSYCPCLPPVLPSSRPVFRMSSFPPTHPASLLSCLPPILTPSVSSTSCPVLPISCLLFVPPAQHLSCHLSILTDISYFLLS